VLLDALGGGRRRRAEEIGANSTLCVRSLTHRPLACTTSPAPMVAAWPITVIRSRWPRAFTRSALKPLSSLWKVTRSTRPARFSRCGVPGDPLARECSTMTADQTRAFGMKTGCLLQRWRIMTTGSSGVGAH
jgi:hypothetical protein